MSLHESQHSGVATPEQLLADRYLSELIHCREAILASSQFSLPFDNLGFTSSDEDLVAYRVRLTDACKAVRARRARRQTATLDGINLALPLPLFMFVDEIEREEDRGASLTRQARYTPDNMPDGFDTLTEDVIAKLCAGLFYNQLRLVLEPKTSAENRREALEWLLAEYYELDGHDAKKHISLIPFTAQFACEVEEIDYDEFRFRLEVALELAKQQHSTETGDPATLIQDDPHNTRDFADEGGHTHEGAIYGTQNIERTLWS